MIIIGLDPSLKQTGYALIEHPSLQIVKAGIISTSAGDEYYKRIKIIYDEIFELIKKNKPIHAAIEESFYSKNVKTANQLAQVRIILILAAMQNDLTISLFSPNSIKKAVTGRGHASKEQVAYMVKEIFNIDKDIPNDVSDALATAYTFISRSFNE
ncbi:crossover junction endodeoxyribonuclease RuvC [candidate division WOR-3 bacterium]|nr:crossover junction endodeoxyribonuclease RuvC [candidate division WOR-3 bacterium]